MGLNKTIWTKPSEYIRSHKPTDPVLFFAPAVLQATAHKFLEGFPGLVTYAVKTNPDEVVLTNLVAAGIRGFDVASPAEIELVSRIAPGAALHYNNPVRGRNEIETAVRFNVKSWSVDSFSELEKLIELVPAENCEISVRIKLPVQGAAYNFGAKFGATFDKAVALLQRVAEAGFIPSITFHPGTQCVDPMAWDSYIRSAADVARAAGVKLARLNVGGGFPAHRLTDVTPKIDEIFELIGRVTKEAFGDDAPALVCEPGRGIVAESYSAAVAIKAIRDGEHVFMCDGVYGLFDELPVIGIIDRIEVMSPEGKPRTGEPIARICFGPTCDSIDRLPGELMLPSDMQEGDYMVFNGFGAYSTATATHFNGFGNVGLETVYAFKG